MYERKQVKKQQVSWEKYFKIQNIEDRIVRQLHKACVCVVLILCSSACGLVLPAVVAAKCVVGLRTRGKSFMIDLQQISSYGKIQFLL